MASVNAYNDEREGKRWQQGQTASECDQKSWQSPITRELATSKNRRADRQARPPVFFLPRDERIRKRKRN
jgi:hypothetical protein